jgi:phosphohistidine phosphatase SixA
MQLFIIRHAYAGQHGDPRWPNDELRPLTGKGRKRFSRLVKKLARGDFSPTVIGTSPLVRCRQTADALAERLGLEDHVVELDALRPDSQLDELVSWTNQQGAQAVAWVGHSPDVEELAATLLGARSGALRFAKGAVAAIDFDEGVGRDQGELLWLATPSSMNA